MDISSLKFLIDYMILLKDAYQNIQPAVTYYAGTPTGNAINEFIEFADGVMSAFGCDNFFEEENNNGME